MSNQINKKVLAEKIKQKLNSPKYIAMSDLITYDDRHGKILTWLWGTSLDGNIYKADNWISGRNINPGKGNKYDSEHMVSYNELEKDDWGEIVRLIEKRNKEKEQLFEKKRKNMEQNLNQQSNLYYYWGAGWRKKERNENADVWVEDKGMRGFVTLLGGQGNGLTYHLYIAENHPVLNNFAFRTGYYSIETNHPIEKRTGRYNGFRSTGGKSNPHNWEKFVEVGDQITITPYQVENNSKLSGNNKLPENQEGKCDICQKVELKPGREGVYVGDYRGSNSRRLHICQTCYSNKEQEYLQNYGFIYSYRKGTGYIKTAGAPCYTDSKDQNGKVLLQKNCPHCQPWKNHKTDNKIEKLSNKAGQEITKWLVQYFQENDIQEIALKNGELVITHNNKIVSPKQITNSHELQNIESVLAKSNEKTLRLAELQKLLGDSNTPQNSTPDSSKNGSTPYLIGGAIGLGLVVVVATSCYLGKKKSKKNRE